MERMIYCDGTLEIFKSGVRRENYSRHHRDIKSVADFKATLRAGSTTDFGGYPLFFVMSDGESLCFDCARAGAANVISAIQTKSRNGWRIVGCDVNYEDEELTCAHCNSAIQPAYTNDCE